jgi:hypothetical protein
MEQDYAAASGGGGVSAVQLIVQLAIYGAMVAGMWKVFEKAGKPGWAAIIPIYNLIVLAEIVGKPMWWGIVAGICCPINIVFIILMNIELAKRFGKVAGYGVGLSLLGFVFYPMLGFGPDQIQGTPVPTKP